MEPVKIHTAVDGTAREPAAADDVLVQPEWLEEHLDDPAVRVVEVDVSRRAHDEWHIDRAVLWNVYQDLKDADYRLVDTASVEQLLARSGIIPDTTVVFYGYAPAMDFWLMKLYGHQDVRLLDCSRDAWRDEGRAVSSQATEPAAVSYVLPEPDGRLRADHSAVRNAIGAPGETLVDVRTWDEYRGSGSGPLAAWSLAAGPVTSPRRFTSRSTVCTMSADRSWPSPTCVRSSPPSISPAEKS